MFSQARLKLTVYYLAITMVISLFFSLAIYTNVSRQIEGFIHIQNQRIQQFRQNDNLELPHPRSRNLPIISVQDLKEQQTKLLHSLLFINSSILLLAGGAGYLLAGQTLQPIKVMMDKQNQFIADASHELRTPIATLQAEMESSLMAKSITDKIARNLIKSNLEEVDHLKKLTNNLLLLTSNQAINFNLQNLQLANILKIAKSRVASLAKHKKIKISSKIPKATIRGDQNSLVEAFIIILENAIKYSHSNSSIFITGSKSDHKISLSIKDQGIGISAKDLPHIFERFYRADKSRSNTDGFGLGLSIAKNIITNHHGSILVSSALNKGSTFTVILPLSKT